jgi:hypothetical protein
MANSVFSQYTKAFLNINDPATLLNRLENTNNTLYDKFISSPFNIQLTSDLYSLAAPVYTHDKLTWKTDGNIAGFNHVKIAETSADPIKLLPFIDENKLPGYNSLLTVHNTISKNYQEFELAKHMQNNYNVEITHNFFTTNYYRYLYHQQDTDYGSKDYDPISLSFLTYYLYVQVYDKIAASLFWELDPNNFISREDLITEFDQYLEAYGEEVAFDFGQFLLENVMTLSKTSTLYRNNIKTAVKSQYPKIKEIFNNNIENIASNFYYQQIISSVLKNLSIYMAGTYRTGLHTYRYLTDVHNKENLIYSTLKDKLFNERQLDLQSQAFITFQFNDNPLFFINSHPFIYSFWNNLLLEEEFSISLLDVPDEEEDDPLIGDQIKQWISNLIVHENQADFRSGLSNYNVQDLLVESKTVEYSCTVWFNQFLDNFLNTEEFHDFIVEDFSLSVITAIQEYYPESSEYVHANIDKIKLFFKMRFMKDILNGKMFPGTPIRIYSQFDEIAVPLSIRESILRDIVTAFMNPGIGERTLYKNHLTDIFQSSFLALFTYHSLDNYRL